MQRENLLRFSFWYRKPFRNWSNQMFKHSWCDWCEDSRKDQDARLWLPSHQTQPGDRHKQLQLFKTSSLSSLSLSSSPPPFLPSPRLLLLLLSPPSFFPSPLQVNLSDLNHELGKAKESLVFESGNTFPSLSFSPLIFFCSVFLLFFIQLWRCCHGQFPGGS